MGTDKEIEDMLDQMINAVGGKVEDLIIITSFTEYKPKPKWKWLYRSTYGDTDVVFDPTLPPKQWRIMHKADYKPMDISEVMQDGSG